MGCTVAIQVHPMKPGMEPEPEPKPEPEPEPVAVSKPVVLPVRKDSYTTIMIDEPELDSEPEYV